MSCQAEEASSEWGKKVQVVRQRQDIWTIKVSIKYLGHWNDEKDNRLKYLGPLKK